MSSPGTQGPAWRVPGSLSSPFPVSSPLSTVLHASQAEAFLDPQPESNNLTVACGFPSKTHLHCDYIQIWVELIGIRIPHLLLTMNPQCSAQCLAHSSCFINIMR